MFGIIMGWPRDGLEEINDVEWVVGVGEVEKADWLRQVGGNKNPVAVF